jgi:hypothetical protein
MKKPRKRGNRRKATDLLVLCVLLAYDPHQPLPIHTDRQTHTQHTSVSPPDLTYNSGEEERTTYLLTNWQLPHIFLMAVRTLSPLTASPTADEGEDEAKREAEEEWEPQPQPGRWECEWAVDVREGGLTERKVRLWMSGRMGREERAGRKERRRREVMAAGLDENTSSVVVQRQEGAEGVSREESKASLDLAFLAQNHHHQPPCLLTSTRSPMAAVAPPAAAPSAAVPPPPAGASHPLSSQTFRRLHPSAYLERFLAEGYRPDGRKVVDGEGAWRGVSVNTGTSFLRVTEEWEEGAREAGREELLGIVGVLSLASSLARSALVSHR